MAELRCPKCGKNNPDILDVCQFCQTPLKKDSVLRIGDTPVKKDTGELEAVLPDWLKNVRQQARDSAEAEEVQAAAQPKAEKDEKPDFLAGLVSQSSDAGEDEIPDWLASINPAASPKPASTPAPAKSDFFAQFNQSEAQPGSQPQQPVVPPFVPEPKADQVPASTDEDDLSKWFAQASEQPEEIVQFDSDAPRQDAAAWTGTFDSPLPTQQEPASQPKEEEDLSWLHNLEDAAKQTGDLQAPKQGADWMTSFEAPSTPPGSSQPQEDLSWLDTLGGVTGEPPQQATEPSTPGDDLSWLNNLQAAESQPFVAAPDQPASTSPFRSEEDLGWLNNLGGASAPAQPAQAAAAQQEDLSWLNDLAAKSEAPSTPPFTAAEPSAQSAPATPPGKKEEVEPDWLKSVVESTSTPAPSDMSVDWFAKEQPAEDAAQTPQTAPFSDAFAAPSGPSSLSSQDVDSLFSVEMPDWLSRAEPVAEGHAPQETALPPAASDESLAPVDLPSWVQAMRPVEAVISEPTAATEEGPEEKEGPLAGLRGVIPGASIGSSMKPKGISLKLQATDEQQASAALLERILGSETSPRPLTTPSFVWAQQWLRWTLTGLFLLVLGATLFLQPHMMPISADLPQAGKAASTAVESLPAGAKVLVVIDYEPALAGEMEAVGSPVLDHMVLLHHPSLSFISTSPNGVALVERLMSSAGISQSGVEYHNLGFLPGGSTGVLAFVEDPSEALSTSGVEKFSEYAMVVLITDHAESGRVWVEQLQAQKETKPLIVVASAQAAPLLQPYVSARQIAGMIGGLSDATRYEYKNALPTTTRSYWDAFGIGLIMAIALIVFGSLWSLITGIRARRAEAEQG